MSDVGQTEGHTDRLMTIKRGFIMKVQYYCDNKNERNTEQPILYFRRVEYSFMFKWHFC